MDRVWLEEFLAEQAVAAGAGGDLGWLGVVERVSDPVVSWGGVGGEHWGGGFGGGGGLPSWSDVLGSRQLARGFSLVTAPSGGVSDVSFGVSGEVGAPVVGPPAWFLELLDRVSSQEFQSWMEPFEGPSRAVGGVIGGVNPLRAAAFGGLTAAEALVERGVDPRLALGLELAFVPDPTFASRAADLLPLMGFIGTGLRNLQFSGELTDFVSPDLLRSARGNLLRRDEGEMAQLSREIMSNPEGVAEPIKILYDPVEMVWWVGEGNHRAVVASKAGVPGVPVTVLRGRSSEGRGALKQPIPPEGQAFLRAMEEQRHGYVPGNLSPSQLGLPVADRSAVSDWVVGHARSLGLSGESVDDILDQVARTYELNRDWGITMPTLTPARAIPSRPEFSVNNAVALWRSNDQMPTTISLQEEQAQMAALNKTIEDNYDALINNRLGVDATFELFNGAAPNLVTNEVQSASLLDSLFEARNRALYSTPELEEEIIPNVLVENINQPRVAATTADLPTTVNQGFNPNVVVGEAPDDFNASGYLQAFLKTRRTAGDIEYTDEAFAEQQPELVKFVEKNLQRLIDPNMTDERAYNLLGWVAPDLITSLDVVRDLLNDLRLVGLVDTFE